MMRNQESPRPVSASHVPLSILCALYHLKSGCLWTADRRKLDSSDKLPVLKFSELNRRECGPRSRADGAWQLWVLRAAGGGDC